ncbi:MAG: acyl-CoA dehydratase activase [Pseudomonadota bacterium]
MKVAGIDMGGMTTKLVILEDSSILYHGITVTADSSEMAAQRAIERGLHDVHLKMGELSYIIATGMTRKKVSVANEVKSSIICLAKGAIWLFPQARTVIDVGGEETLALNMDKAGRVTLFTSNDKCAAGSGFFLESLAKMLEMSTEDMAKEALKAEKAVNISGTCTIFAEQEILSHTFDVPPVPMPDIIAGLHESLAGRVIGLVKNLRILPEIVLCGGVARNPAFVRSLNKRVSTELLVPEDPQIVPALGAALLAEERAHEGKGN